MKKHKLVTIFVGVALLVEVACGSTKPFEVELEREMAPMLLDGYSDFNLEREGVEVGYVVYSYKPPQTVGPNDIITRAGDRLKASYPCYIPLEQSTFEIQMRCTDRASRAYSIEEFRLLYDPDTQRLYVLEIFDVPRDERRYRDFVAILDEVRQH